MNIQLKITKVNESGLFTITSNLDEIFQAGEWNDFAYPKLKDSKDYAAIDLLTGYEGSFNVVEYAYAEGHCVKDTVEAEDVDFSFSYLINGSEASYSEVYEALNPIPWDSVDSYYAYKDGDVWFVDFIKNGLTVWTENHKTLKEVKTVYSHYAKLGKLELTR
jgi:hypothetical protein